MVELVLTDGTGEGFYGGDATDLFAGEEVAEVLGEVGEGVWVGVAEIHGVALVGEFVLEGEGVEVGVLCLAFYVVLLVGDLLALSHPPDLPLLIPHLREHRGLHPIIKQRVILDIINHTEF